MTKTIDFDALLSAPSAVTAPSNRDMAFNPVRSKVLRIGQYGGSMVVTRISPSVSADSAPSTPAETGSENVNFRYVAPLKGVEYTPSGLKNSWFIPMAN